MGTVFSVVGAGMAGLLAAGILRDHCEELLEAQPDLPNNHSALLRFRSSVVGDALNIPFEKVRVIKSIVSSNTNPIADMLSYSKKVTGTATLRSLVSAKGEIEERYIAPGNLIHQMRDKLYDCDIKWNTSLTKEIIANTSRPIISTIPMPALMRILGYEHDLTFAYRRGFVLTADLVGVDVCATLYFPGIGHSYYRASITKNKLIVEFTDSVAAQRLANFKNDLAGQYDLERIATAVLYYFGLDETSLVRGLTDVHEMKYAKILPIDEKERRKFIMWASEKHNVYSLGRFATWRPGLLLDDVVDDVRKIQKIHQNGAYEYKL